MKLFLVFFFLFACFSEKMKTHLYFVFKLNCILQKIVLNKTNLFPSSSFQVWFQNRRAKFRRNERSLSMQQQSPKSNPKSAPFPSRTEITEQPLYPHQPLLPSPNPDIQYVMPWKFSHSHYAQEDYYNNVPNLGNPLTSQTCAFLPPNFNYCSVNVPANPCNRLDVPSLKYRPHDFSLSPQM